MARYGDLDSVKLKVQRYLIPNTDVDGTVDVAVAERWFLKLLDEEPTADVAPKSEVEELIRENESLAKTVNEASSLIRKLRNRVEKSQTEVAREIFKEIEKNECHDISGKTTMYMLFCRGICRT